MQVIFVKAKSIVIFFSFIFILCCLFSVENIGQLKAETVIESEDTCEKHIAAYDIIFNAANNPPYPASIIVIIARLGDGENSSKLNQQRLAVAKKSLPNGYPAENIVTAQGDKIKGKGQIEFYVNGNFLTAFKVERKKNLTGRCLEKPK